MPPFNSMQANLGLIPGVGAPSSTIQSPSNIASQLSQQASQQLQEAQSRLPVALGGGAAFSFGQQFQQQLHQIQQQQSMNIYHAAMMSGGMPGASMMPSPLTMTPASTGIFRPPAQAPSFAPVAPMPVMPLAPTPFEPQMPAPMFRTAWEQEVQQRELRADQIYSYTAQAPRAAGQAAGIGMGALAGGLLGARFGGVGRAIGALAGGGLAQFSGAAPALGQAAMLPMRPSMEAHQMGASLQRMSQDWVVGGSQLHPLGRGFGRGASMELAQGLQQMAGSGQFQRETGGMFNRHDLMMMTQQAGQRGLLDEQQSIQGVQQQMRQVAQVVRQFMQLTNDPDVTNVIRQMGQMRQMGLSVADMENAAQNMRTFSRAAGTTIGGMMQTYGMPGAATYQQAGLSAGAGMNYGMYAGAAARQAVAAQTFSPMQLSMLGGVQGVAQRNMQAQAAMMSMPLMGAAMGGFQGGQWGLNYGAAGALMGGNVGAQDVVRGAVQNINQAVQQGGIGALAMFPLQQRFIQSEAANAMSPYEQNVMRFQMAQRTGEQFGLKGAGAFAFGSRALFGTEVAEQMMLEASNPEYWRSQRAVIRRDQDELARMQRQEIKENAPGFFESLVGGPLSGLRRGIGTVAETVAAPFKALGRGVQYAREGIGNYWEDQAATAAGDIITRIDKRFTSDDINVQRAQAEWMKTISPTLLQSQVASARGSGVDYAQFYRDYARTLGGEDPNQRLSGGALTSIADVLAPIPGVDVATTESAFGYGAYSDLTAAQRQSVMENRSRFNAASRRMYKESANYDPRSESATATRKLVQDTFKTKVSGFSVMNQAGGLLAKRAGEMADAFQPGQNVTSNTARAAVIDVIAANSDLDKKEIANRFDKLSEEDKAAIVADTLGYAYIVANAAQKESFMQSEKDILGGEERRRVADLKQITESAAKRLEDLEESLDFTDWNDNPRPGLDKIREIVKVARKSELMLMVQNEAAQVGEIGAQINQSEKDIKAQIAKDFGLTIKADDSEEEKARKREAIEAKYIQMSSDVAEGKFQFGKGKMITEDVKARVRGAIGKAGYMRTVRDVAKMGETTKLATVSTSLAKGTEALEAVLKKDKGRLDLNQLLSLSDEDLKRMEASPEFKPLGKMIRTAQTEEDPEKRAELLQQITSSLVAKGGPVKEESVDTLTSARGEKAQQLKKAGAAIEGAEAQFAEVFKNFNKDSTYNFKEGARLLREALVVGDLVYRRKNE